MSIEENSYRQTKSTPTRVKEDLLLLLEKMVGVVEGIWRDEVKAQKTDIRRRKILRNAHHALGEWLELETLGRRNVHQHLGELE